MHIPAAAAWAWLPTAGGRPAGGLVVAHALDPWRALPADFPPAGTVYWRADKWQADGSAERMHDDLRDRVRITAGRQAVPTAAIIDAQSVKGSEMISRTRRGYDAGKKINGTKRHIAVDALGLLLTVLVTADKLVTWARTRLTPKLTLEIVRRPDDLHTFQVLTRRLARATARPQAT